MTAYTYDEVPYPGLSYPPSHPDRLLVLARLMGLTPAPLEACRVLELGCAAGGNIIPMADLLRGSTFVGVDESGVQIRQGQDTIKALELSNITLQQMDIMDITPDFGQFDILIAHGVFSWVPAVVQDKLLDICAHNLAPQGIAYISYNTYPGWHRLNIVRDLMLYRTRRAESPLDKVRQAAEMVAFTAEMGAAADDASYAAFLNQYLETRKARLDPAVLLHDEMGAVNSPVYFHQFIERAAQHGLQYLTEADFSTALSADLPREAVQYLAHIADDLIEREQYLDFLRNRTFRATLLCHADVAVTRQLSPESVKQFYIVSSAEALPADTPDREQFRGADGKAFVTDHRLTRAALHHLIEAAPCAVHFEALVRHAAEPLGAPPANDDVMTVAANLLHMFSVSMNLIEFHGYAPPITRQIRERPRALRVARFQAQGDNRITNAWHRAIELNSFSRIVLLNLDGQVDRATLLNFLVGLVQQGKISLQEEGEAPLSADRLRAIVTSELDDTLGWLARRALLVE